VLSLDPHNTYTPLLTISSVIIVLSSCLLDNLLQLGKILLASLSDGKGGRGLLVHQVTQSALSLDDDIRHIHLTAEGWKPDNQLNRLHIMSNHHEFCFLGLNEVSDVIQTILDEERLRSSLHSCVLSSASRRCRALLSLLLLLNRLRSVVGEKAKEIGSSVLIESFGELIDGRRNFESLFENGSLSLQTNVLWLEHISRQVSGRWDGLSNTERTSLLGEQVLVGSGERRLLP